MKFIDQLINKTAKPEDIRASINEWHDSLSSEKLYDYLGITEDEYLTWGEHKVNGRESAANSYLEQLASIKRGLAQFQAGEFVSPPSLEDDWLEDDK